MCGDANNPGNRGNGMTWRLKGVIQVSFIAAAIAISISMTTLAQKNDSTIEEPPATSKFTDEGISSCSKSIAPSKHDSQRHFNELRRELLDDRADTIDWWLASLAVILGFFGIVAVLGGYIGFRRFREIEVEARKSVDAAKRYVEAARNDAKGIAALKQEVVANAEQMRSITAEYAAENPKEVNQAVIDAQTNPQSSLIEKAIADALELQQKGKKNEAIEKWHAIAKIADGIDNDIAARAWFSVGYLVGFRDLVGCIDAYNHAIQLKPDYPDALNNRGNAKGNLGQHAEAIADFDQAIRLKPDFFFAYNNRGVAKGVLGRHEEAIADFDQAIKLKPDYAEAFNNRGNAKRNLGQYAEAITDYDQAIRLKPDLAETFNNRGNAKVRLGRDEEAIADFDQAIRLKPNLAEAFEHRGTAKGQLGRNEEAIADYDQAIRLRPDRGEAYLNRGWARANSGDKEGARSDYELSLKLARKSGDAELESRAAQDIKKLAGDIDSTSPDSQ